ncbi:hypothetical protein [Candidatus Spongiisocius sp.]|uniref:hypothetical protein n=1 Tax=Candidatus Spongiisocius sp. TaxID=3101273 RepID=UPI003B59CAD4
MKTASTATGSAGIVVEGSTGSVEEAVAGGSAVITASGASVAGGSAMVPASEDGVAGTVVASGLLLVEEVGAPTGAAPAQAPRRKHPSRATAKSVVDPDAARQGGPDP